jgi:hypothetical protein
MTSTSTPTLGAADAAQQRRAERAAALNALSAPLPGDRNEPHQGRARGGSHTPSSPARGESK